MKVSQRFTVESTPDEVWNFLCNVREVANCVPGFELTDEKDDGTYLGKFHVKIGPVTARLEGEGLLVRNDEEFSATIEGKGIDKRGGSRANGKMRYSVIEDPAGAAVEVEADVTLAGPLAQVGRTGIVEDVARALTEEFAANLAARITSVPGAAPALRMSQEKAGRDEVGPAETGSRQNSNQAETSSTTKGFDAGSVVTKALWRRFISLLKRLLGLQE